MPEVVTCTIYLNAANDVVALASEMEGHTTMSLVDFQVRDPTATQRIAGGPLSLRRLADSGVYCAYHHRWTSGDGTLLFHYTEIAGRKPDSRKSVEERLSNIEARLGRIEVFLNIPKSAKSLDPEGGEVR